MIEHWKDQSEALNLIKSNALIVKRVAPLDTVEHIMMYFNHITWAIKQLECI